jgi:alpha-mannosidase
MKFLAVLTVMMLNLAIAEGNSINSKEFSEAENKREPLSNIQKGSILKILKVEPTVFFRNDQNGLMQAVDITIGNSGQEAKGQLRVKFRSLKELSVDIGTIKSGEGKYRFFIPEVTVVKPVEYLLMTAEKIADRLVSNWTPRKHWEICIIPISHHDLGYTAPIEHVMRTYRETYTDVINFCEQTATYPDEAKFRYSVEESWSLQNFIENSDKETREKLAKYIKEGRIEVQAFYAELTSNIASHEELIRLMYPSFRINKEFGGQIQVGSITDIPGLSWGLPIALSGAGIKYFYAGMPTYFEWDWDIYKDRVKHTFWDEKNILRPHGKPDAFYWKGPDGSKVLVYYQGSYGWWNMKSMEGPKSYDQIMNELPDTLNDMDKRGVPFSVMRFGGFGCTDNTKTDIIISNVVKEWNSKWAYPKFIVSTNAMFFEKLEKQCKDLRTFTGDMPDTDYPVGAISMAKETTQNRVTHDRIASAEKIAAMSYILLNSNYPADDIRDVYDNIMLYDEHCWGMYHGVSDVAEWAFDEKSSCSYKALGLTELITSGGVSQYDQTTYESNGKNIANNIAFDKEGQHIVVFNSLSFNRNDLVNIPNFLHKEPFDLIDIETGQKVPYQVINIESPQSPVPHAAGRYANGQIYPAEGFNLAFVAEKVPSMGYKTYRIVPAGSSGAIQSSLILTDKSIENRFFKVTINPLTGTVASIFDKELGTELVDKDAPHQVNQLITRWIKTGKEESPKTATIRIGQSGPVYASLVVSTSGAGCPQLTQEIILYDKIKRVDFNNRVLKDMTPTQEIYFAFPFMMDNPDIRFEGPLSVIKPLRDQFPGSNTNYYSVQHWADVSNGKTGITFSPVDAHLVMFGGLNNVETSQAHHAVDPVNYGSPFITEIKKGHMYSFVMDNNFRTNMQPVQLGDVLFRYSVTSHKGDWIEGTPRDFGWAVKNPFIPVVVNGKSKGKLPESLSLCQVDKPNVILLTLKKAEDGEGIIIRLNETEGRDTEVNLTLPKMNIAKVYETNLVEENEQLLATQGQTIKINLNAFGIKTLRIL